MTGVEVAGIGLHPFGRFADRGLVDLGATAVRAAMADAGITAGGFQAAFCGTAYGGIATGHRVLDALGLTSGPIVDVEAGCASGAAALMLGAAAIADGRYDTVLCFGVERMPKGMIRSTFFDPWREQAGLAATPAYFALRAQRVLADTGLDEADLAALVVRNRAWGVHNPDAMFRKAVTAEEVLASRMVCPPLRLWMLCSPNEGAAAVVLRRARAGAGPTVKVAAAVVRSHLPGHVLSEATPLSGLVDDTIVAPSTLAATEAYEAAGIAPADVDVAEVQDTDAARQLGSMAEVGLVPVDGLKRWLADESGLPINRSGGLLSKGEPLGASALGQVVELTRQLRGQADDRQVDGATVALGHTVGRGANASVTILTA